MRSGVRWNYHIFNWMLCYCLYERRETVQLKTQRYLVWQLKLTDLLFFSVLDLLFRRHCCCVRSSSIPGWITKFCILVPRISKLWQPIVGQSFGIDCASCPGCFVCTSGSCSSPCRSGHSDRQSVSKRNKSSKLPKLSILWHFWFAICSSCRSIARIQWTLVSGRN